MRMKHLVEGNEEYADIQVGVYIVESAAGHIVYKLRRAIYTLHFGIWSRLALKKINIATCLLSCRKTEIARKFQQRLKSRMRWARST